MSIICQICQTEFEKIIPWQHLKTHGVSTEEYKKKYGSLYSPETIAKYAARIPHNKGKKVTDPTQLENIRLATAKREERFRNGEFTRGKEKTVEQKQALSQRSKEYADANPEKMRHRTQKAIATKKERGYDFGSPFRGKKHSNNTIETIRQSAIESNLKKSQEANGSILERIHQLDLILLNDITEWHLLLQCKKCNTEFSFTKQYLQPSKVKDTICPHCYPRTVKHSKGELELFAYIQSLCPDAINGYKVDDKYHSKEIDVFVPSLNIGVEFNGIYYHSEQVLMSINKSPTSDYEKQKEFALKGIRIIPIFSDEWEEKREIVKSRIANILGKTNEVIYARKCSIAEVSSQDASKFCQDNHLMGKGRSNFRLGLYYNNKLVSLMTFTNNNLSRKSKVWEINRFASLLGLSVVGGASKLFAAFIKQVQPESVISYADSRWSTGGLYSAIGFTKASEGSPNYWYVKPNSGRIHRFSLRKNKNDDQNLTEVENRLSQGYLRIWDCGSSKWIWTSAASKLATSN